MENIFVKTIPFYVKACNKTKFEFVQKTIQLATDQVLFIANGNLKIKPVLAFWTCLLHVRLREL